MSQNLNADGSLRQPHETGPTLMELEREAEATGKSKEEILAAWQGATPAPPKPAPAAKRAAKSARK
jgi:hypothetical protein